MKDYSEFETEVISVKVIHVIKSFFRKKIRIDLPDFVAILVMEIVLGAIGMVVWVLTGVSKAYFASLWGAWGLLFSGLTIYFVKINLNRFLFISNRDAKEIFGNQLSTFEKWLTDNFSLKRQIIFSSIFSLIFYPITFVFFQEAIGRYAIIFVSFILLFNLFLIGNGLYWIIVLPGAAKSMRENAQRMFCFDPSNTIWLTDFADIFQGAALYTSVVGIAILAPLLGSFSSDYTVQIVSLGWFIFVWALVIIPYFMAQSSLSGLIRDEKLNTLSSLQKKIYSLLMDCKDPQEITHAQQLLSLYTQTLTSERSSWKLGSSLKFINSLLLPFLSFIIVNFFELVNLIKQVFGTVPHFP
jgi:hypothetical protein